MVDHTPELEIISNAYASGFKVEGKLVTKLSGCIYRNDGTRVDNSERLSGFKGDRVINDNPPSLIHTAKTSEISYKESHTSFSTISDFINSSNSKRIYGRSIYLGHYMGLHYGHFITEGLGACWYLVNPPESAPLKPVDFDHFVFHPFIFDIKISRCASICFKALGIDLDKIMFIGEQPIQFEELYVPERLFKLNHSVHHKMKKVYDCIQLNTMHGVEQSGNLANNKTSFFYHFNTNKKVYISRRKISWQNHARVVINENHIEKIFFDMGFTVVYPETLPFEDQVRLFSEASVIAGLSGSALHNSIFMKRGSIIIEIGDPRYKKQAAPNQQLCNELSGVTDIQIPFEGKIFGLLPVFYFDLEYLQSKLENLQEINFRLKENFYSKTKFRRLYTVLYLLEMGYLIAAPSMRYIFRKLKQKFTLT